LHAPLTCEPRGMVHPMRFSLKCLLAVMSYVAIAVAAFARPHWAFGDVLRGVVFVGMVYAAILAVHVP
jgi:hypothetical protein